MEKLCWIRHRQKLKRKRGKLCFIQTIFQETEDYRIQCEYNQDEYGVISRCDCFENTSGKEITVNCLKSRFVFEGGEYEVYTQFNTWQNESTGGWQTLVSCVSVSGASSRTTQDAVPFIVLWSEQTQRGVAFHLLPNSAWEMKVTRVGHYCKYTKVVVELGILNYNFNITLAPGEKINMPEIICYEVKSKLHMDCYKLHNYLHTRCPRKRMPMIYNTWMGNSDNLSFDNLAKQIPLAADLGLEYFVIDAGWFGKGEGWSQSVGDWSENVTGALGGRMIEIADMVRASGMKFGLWLEPQRAVPQSDSVKNYRKYYIDGDVESEFCFLDFANEEAREWMLEVVSGLIDRYGIEYIKDDYNADMYFDVHHTAFLKYHEGHTKFFQALRDRYPNIYITNCASGGERLELGSYMKFDSAWPSDNESPYKEMSIYKQTLLRMPPQGFERWVCVHSLNGYEKFYQLFEGSNDGMCERIVACSDAVWHNIVGVQPSFLEGYMTGGPIGFSCDLSLLSEAARKKFREYIAKMKAEQEFWLKAVARIICDTKSITAYQYSDMALTRVVVQLFTHETMQDSFRIYPEVDENKTYRTEVGDVLMGKTILQDGIQFKTKEWHDNWYEMHQITLSSL